MTHDCPTGSHPTPSRRCYWAHRCRCSGCRSDLNDYLRARRDGEKPPPAPKSKKVPRTSSGGGRPATEYVPPAHKTVVVPAKSWDRIVAALGRRGVSPGEWLDAVAAVAERRVA